MFTLKFVAVSLLAFFYFRAASERTRIAVFVVLFVGVASFGVSVVRTTSNDVGPSPIARPTSSTATRAPTVSLPASTVTAQGERVRGRGIGEQLSFYNAFTAGSGM